MQSPGHKEGEGWEKGGGGGGGRGWGREECDEAAQKKS